MKKSLMESPFNYPDRISLFDGITPIIFLEKVTEKFGNGIKIFLKRDDLTGMELSGNKVRKLEFLLADALKKGCDTILTYGGIQSNHCRATAAACAKLGLKCRIILRTPTPQKPYDGNLLLDNLFGAKIDFVPREKFNKDVINDIIKAETRRGNKVYYFPVGGSVPYGCWGYVKCFEEIIQQEKEKKLKFDNIFCTLGSGGTMTGLIMGKELFKRKNINIFGVNVCDSEEYFREEITNLLHETKKIFKLGYDVSKMAINIFGGYVGEGYAIPYEKEIRVIKEAAKLEGILLDPTYTGKAFYGMLDQIKKGRFKKGESILFIHTGGIFGLFPQRDLF